MQSWLALLEKAEAIRQRQHARARARRVRPVAACGAPCGMFYERMIAATVDVLLIGTVAMVPLSWMDGATLLVVWGWQMTVITIYILFFWRSYAATPGKMLFGLWIVDAATGTPLSHAQTTRRFLAYMLSVPSLLGVFWISWQKECRGWHDLMAGTAVVKRRKPGYAASEKI